MFDKRLNFFIGHFGSGKTEVAVNYALNLKKHRDKVCIVDFDIVNPFFRTADAKENLEKHDIKVILPLYANTNVDVPAISPEIGSMFQNKEYGVVFDVGGDDLGAKAVSRYAGEIVNHDFEMFFVINTRRPMTDTIEKIEGMIEEIQQSARIKVTKLINNTNLLGETTPELILEGQKMIEEVSENLKIPIGFISGLSEIIVPIEERLAFPILPLDKNIRLPWDL